MSRAQQAALVLADGGPRAATLRRMLDREADALVHDWSWWGRPEQQPPTGDAWTTWLVQAGRGFGKTRTGAEAVRGFVGAGKVGSLALIGKTPADVRDVMIDGPAGIRTITPEHERPVHVPSRRALRWPNGATALIFSGEAPDQLRGPQFELSWGDELEAYQYPLATLDNATLGRRVTWTDGSPARAIWTTTPRNTPALRKLRREPGLVVTRGSTYDNADNLDAAFLRSLLAMYEGTRLGQQELHAEDLDDAEGALWKRAWIDLHRIERAPDLSGIQRIVVAIDPAATAHSESAETGIIVAALTNDEHVVVLEDLSGRMSPVEWGTRAIEAHDRWGADALVIETNQGGDMAVNVLRTISAVVAIRRVHASRGKLTRAEPAAALYEQGRVHHVGTLALLEDQLCTYGGGPSEASPDRMDALVWALFDLLIREQTAAVYVV